MHVDFKEFEDEAWKEFYEVEDEALPTDIPSLRSASIKILFFQSVAWEGEDGGKSLSVLLSWRAPWGAVRPSYFLLIVMSKEAFIRSLLY